MPPEQLPALLLAILAVGYTPVTALLLLAGPGANLVWLLAGGAIKPFVSRYAGTVSIVMAAACLGEDSAHFVRSGPYTVSCVPLTRKMFIVLKLGVCVPLSLNISLRITWGVMLRYIYLDRMTHAPHEIHTPIDWTHTRYCLS